MSENTNQTSAPAAKNGNGRRKRLLLQLGAAGGVVLLLAPRGWSFAPSGQIRTTPVSSFR